MLIPRRHVPPLAVETLRHGAFDIAAEHPERFSLVVFYRGLHCPICARYLGELGRLLPAFGERGISVIAMSCDIQERAELMAMKVDAPDLRIGYGLGLRSAVDWGLAISEARIGAWTGLEEPARFAEPGVFLVRRDATLYYASVQTMPFARPHFEELIGALDFAIAHDYPARGEFTGTV